MRYALSVTVMLLTLALSTHGADATQSEACCACLPLGAEMGTAAQLQEPRTALFCGDFAETQEPADRCQQLDGVLLCIAQLPAEAAVSSECRELLLSEAQITCPLSTGAPVSGAWGLTALALLLAGGGMVAVRRRAARGA